MKNLITILFLTIGISLNAQYYSITYVNVPAENQAEFARIETQYWSKVAKANIDADKQVAWGLVAAVGGTPNGWTHAFVNIFETAEDLANANQNWNSEAIIGISSSEINTVPLTDGGFAYQNWAVQTSIPGPRPEGRVMVWNFARPKNLAGFIDENKNLWKKQFENDMGGRISWGLGLKLNNRSNNLSTVMTWDSYPSLADALKALNTYGGEWPRQSKMQEYDPDGWTAQVIVSDVMWVN
ncbi:MAG: hypothetical protein VW988_05345 [Gammaproteobacteria bacterium]|jgi:hypothetical protein|tara:strand:+ start:4856 stop:5575 length:720 start_codon:yes stop_codon:yes gene_type:complete